MGSLRPSGAGGGPDGGSPSALSVAALPLPWRASRRRLRFVGYSWHESGYTGSLRACTMERWHWCERVFGHGCYLLPLAETSAYLDNSRGSGSVQKYSWSSASAALMRRFGSSVNSLSMRSIACSSMLFLCQSRREYDESGWPRASELPETYSLKNSRTRRG